VCRAGTGAPRAVHRGLRPLTTHLFAYGTLRPDRAPPGIAAVARRLGRVAAATISGRLYDLGSYPGAVLDPCTNAKVHGEVLRLPDDPDVLARLDAYEGFDPSEPRRSLFVRVTTRATLTDGRTLACWVYVYNREPAGAPLLAGGRWSADEAR